MTTPSSILAWRIPLTEEPDGLQPRVIKGWTQLKDLALGPSPNIQGWLWHVLWLFPRHTSSHAVPCILCFWRFKLVLSSLPPPPPAPVTCATFTSIYCLLFLQYPFLLSESKWSLFDYWNSACHFLWKADSNQLQSGIAVSSSGWYTLYPSVITALELGHETSELSPVTVEI